jgi:hypothetical protein
MKNSFLLLGSLLLVSIFSCVDSNNDNVVKISFTTIVGNYDGFSKFCSAPTIATDTICSPFENNVLNVIIFDQQSIQIDDTKDYFSKSKLILKSSSVNNGDQFHFFGSQESPSDFTLVYNETKKSVLVSKKSQEGNVLKYEVFEGQK